MERRMKMNEDLLIEIVQNETILIGFLADIENYLATGLRPHTYMSTSRDNVTELQASIMEKIEELFKNKSNIENDDKIEDGLKFP